MKIKKTQQFLSKAKRLIKKIGVFELLIGFLILLVLILVMVQLRSKEQWVKAEVKISASSWWQAYFTAPPYWLGESIKVGDKEFDPQGKVVAEVLSVRIHELSTLQHQEPTRKDFYLTLNLRVSKDRRTGKLKFKNQPLEIGGPIELHLTNTYASGLVTFVEGVPDERETKGLIIKGVWANTVPWDAEAIPVGGRMMDGMGNVVAEILEKRIELAEKTVETWDGRLVTSRDPLKRDIYLKIKLLTKKQGENFYFHEDQKVKIGETLFIQLPGVDVDWISIMEIYDKDEKRLY
ncbi:DUF4330 domain-containing protein [Patescibacteria group bacterium]|nr:DUF4330 domain-containing protein [Patescibacteria group bacterium]